jgi:DNA-directed RNA polymerase specialized sigma24 family protein
VDNSVIAANIRERIHKRRDRQIMARKLIDGATYEEIAEEVGMSPRGVKYVVQRHRDTIA